VIHQRLAILQPRLLRLEAALANSNFVGTYFRAGSATMGHGDSPIQSFGENKISIPRPTLYSYNSINRFSTFFSNIRTPASGQQNSPPNPPQQFAAPPPQPRP
jgi:hypothetical protein